MWVLTLICPLQNPAESVILNHPDTSGIPYSKTVISTAEKPKMMSLAGSLQDLFTLCQTLKITCLQFCKKKITDNGLEFRYSFMLMLIYQDEKINAITYVAEILLYA
jgi:hypothetical protein